MGAVVFLLAGAAWAGPFAPPAAGQPAAAAPLNIIAFGAHPDDCDIRAGGTGAKFAAAGHAVKFVALTNGDAGHQTQGGGALARRRRLEAAEAGRRLGVEYITLDNHDGELLPTLQVRQQIIREIRRWNADVVLASRPNDYHPDHRYAGMLVQDAAYMVVVPNVCPDTPPLRKNPVFFYFEDGFQKPSPFRPDVAVDITDVWEKKVDAMDAHLSQMYEWLPWVDGKLETVPSGAQARRKWLSESFRSQPPTPAVRQALEKWYGAERARNVRHAEAFELCEYGSRPDEAGLKRLFPIIK
jgi:LmbE family N-acetylglucosaminyl deacetylase